jgi:hypothetical protein
MQSFFGPDSEAAMDRLTYSWIDVSPLWFSRTKFDDFTRHAEVELAIGGLLHIRQNDNLGFNADSVQMALQRQLA